MAFSLLSTSIEIKKSDEEMGEPEFSIFSRPHFKVKEDDFFLNVKDVARYRVQNGEKIQICPYENANDESVMLFLEGSVFGALLHQRGILPFHGSSFVHKGKGIAVCGCSGAGKSAVTAAFCGQGATFVNDDITPVSVTGTETNILPVKTRIKLWNDSLRELELVSGNLQKIRPGMEKFYLPVEERYENEHPLNYIFILSMHNKDEFRATELKGIEKYRALRHQIYRKIYLKGMPETEKRYFGQLLFLASKVPVITIVRPQICDIQKTMRFIDTEIEA
jgi:hypothetical protein